MARARGDGVRWGPMDGACSSSSWLLGPTCAERGGGQGEGAASVAFTAGMHDKARASGLAEREGVRGRSNRCDVFYGRT